MAIPSYGVQYFDPEKDGKKTVEMWEEGGFKYLVNQRRGEKLYMRCAEVTIQ